MERPTRSPPRKDAKEELSTSTTTQTTATRGVGEKFRTLSIDFFGNKLNRNERGRSDVLKRAREGKGRLRQRLVGREEFDGLVPKGFRAVHGRDFVFDLEKNDEKKKKKILIFPGSRLYARKKHVKTKRAHNAEHDEIVTVEEDTNTVVWASSSEQVQTVRVKLALPSDVLQVQFCGLDFENGARERRVCVRCTKTVCWCTIRYQERFWTYRDRKGVERCGLALLVWCLGESMMGRCFGRASDRRPRVEEDRW